MKKLNTLIVAIITIIAISSCSKEKSTLEKLQGEWERTGIYVNDIRQAQASDAIGGRMLFTFYNITDNKGTLQLKNNYTLNNGQATLLNDFRVLGTAPFELISPTTIAIHYGNGSTMEILELTNSILIVREKGSVVHFSKM